MSLVRKRVREKLTRKRLGEKVGLTQRMEDTTRQIDSRAGIRVWG